MDNDIEKLTRLAINGQENLVVTRCLIRGTERAIDSLSRRKGLRAWLALRVERLRLRGFMWVDRMERRLLATTRDVLESHEDDRDDRWWR